MRTQTIGATCVQTARVRRLVGCGVAAALIACGGAPTAASRTHDSDDTATSADTADTGHTADTANSTDTADTANSTDTADTGCSAMVDVTYEVVDTDNNCLQTVTESRCADYWARYASGDCNDVEPPLLEASGRCLVLRCDDGDIASDPAVATYPAYGTDCESAVTAASGAICAP